MDELLARLRRMVSEEGLESLYDSLMLSEAIRRYAVPDAARNEPLTSGGALNSAWTPTYDLNAAAAEIWEEKAARLASNFDFSADGASYSRSQAHAHATAQATRFRARRRARSVAVPSEPPAPYDTLNEV